MTEEILKSLKEVLKNRLTNPVYGTFIICWLTLHWQLVFSLLFLDQNIILARTGLLKNEYLSIRFFNFHDPLLYLSWIVPFGMTYLIIWFLPTWIFIPAFRKEREYESEKIKIKIRLERELEQEKTELVEQEKIKFQTIIETNKKKEEVKNADPNVEWSQEYKEFETHENFNDFNYIIDAIYDNNGYKTDLINNNKSHLLGYCDAMNLIELYNQNMQIRLTEKGKYFVKNYLNSDALKLKTMFA